MAGRLKSDYRYSSGVVYNNFIFPKVDTKTKMDVEKQAQAMLDTRELYPDSTLAGMHDPKNIFIYPDLMKAHREQDDAVERAYGVDFTGDEQKIVTHLFKLHNNLCNQLRTP